MTTNGLLINEMMLETSKAKGFSGFQVTLDGCEERHDKVRFISEGKGSYRKILQNIFLAAKFKIHVNVRLNISPETLDGIMDIVKDFQTLTDEDRKYITFNMHKVWQVEEPINEKITKVEFAFKNEGFNVNIGKSTPPLSSCYADKRYQATLNYNGEVFKCTARDFTNNSGEGVLNNDGQIIWNERFEKRMNVKFNNKPCMECRILPICSGGCSQHALESAGKDYCVYEFDEEAKLQLVINRFIALVD